ncbi:hypothetical protein [Nocardioides coralli]|uniref:hypothetical protein n=1 Tax=Nocardioides coralli TaxID=2872154 RepID=UPI001CA395E5|nr:hypothetical protein [Nocardioides coralli]QZY29168.1 hypothetical protein K6T13_00060 [Nocardioides coralli]
MRATRRIAAAGSVVVAGLLVGCSQPAVEEPRPLLERPTAEPAPPYDASLEPAEAVLSLVPQTAGTITVTDWDQVRVQLGQPDLTSEDLRTDRIAFWTRAEQEAVVLTEGLLREDNSLLELDYGFTQDDVDWEARFTGDEGPGFVIALRPDLDLAGVRRAIADGAGPLADAELRARDHLVVSGTADTDVWASDASWELALDDPAAATYLRRGCIPLNDALGPDADVEDQEALLAEHPVTTLEDLSGFAVTFGDRAATVRTEPGRGDLFERMRIGEAWPVDGFPQTYVNGAADPSSGRIGYALTNPRTAAALALLDELPFGVCNEVVPLAEPTGL